MIPLAPRLRLVWAGGGLGSNIQITRQSPPGSPFPGEARTRESTFRVRPIFLDALKAFFYTEPVWIMSFSKPRPQDRLSFEEWARPFTEARGAVFPGEVILL